MSMEPDIAAAAARLIVEEGMDYRAAKRRALRALGLPERSALPSNDCVEDAVREYIALFCAEEQAEALQALRELALEWMERLREHRPLLTGAVWGGTATRHSDIHLDLFCDDPKSLEIDLINRGLEYEVRSTGGFHGDTVDVLSLHAVCDALGESIGVHLAVHDHDHIRGSLKPGARGRAARGDAAALRAMMAGHGDSHGA